MSATLSLESYLAGEWSRGQGIESELVDPTNGTVLATVSARGLDLDVALKFARQKGSPALRALSYAARAKMLGAIADVLAMNRARYEAIAIANSGNTRSDAAIDIDGGIGTLKYYARLGAPLGEANAFIDGKPVRLTKAENYQAIHLLTPRHGAAVHINAFNFPSWGLWEKAACALLAGMPVLAKPASATCLLSHQMVGDVVGAGILPEGTLSLLCGSIGDMLDHVTGDDVIAFTGSSDTASRIRGHRNVLARGTMVNVEADSECRSAGAIGRAGHAGVRCLHQGSRAGDDGQSRPEMHRHPPRAGAGRARGGGSRRAVGAACQDHRRRSANRSNPHGAGCQLRAAGER